MEKMGAMFLLKELFSLRAATDIILVTAVLFFLYMMCFLPKKTFSRYDRRLRSTA